MKIAQLVVNNLPNSSYRYAKELNNQLNKINIDANIISLDTFELNDYNYNLLNAYDYCFIHSLPINQNIYSILTNKIKIKKILFITDINIKQWHNSISLSNIKNLLKSVSNIVLNDLATDIINEIIYLISEESFEEKFIKLTYIYNFKELTIDDIDNKHNSISLISNKGLRANYDLFINMFQQLNFPNLIWHMYGITKNIQTLSINNLYINKETNQKSLITNFSNNIDPNKINIHDIIADDKCYNIIKDNLFIANFDKTNILSYTFLDIIGNGTIPIFDKNIAKNIKVNNLQSIYDLDCCLFIDSKTIDDEFIIQMNKLLTSKNSYLYMINKNIKLFSKLFDNEKTINDLLIALKIK